MNDNFSPRVRAGIVGSAGYTGGELLRILLRHPAVEIVFAHSKSKGGQPLHFVHRDLVGETDLRFSPEVFLEEIEVLFCCLGHGETRRFLENQNLPNTLKIIDLSQDFRLGKTAGLGSPEVSGHSRAFVYGLPELKKTAIRKAQNIANPGCFATALQLALLPLAAAGRLETVHATGITGATGAGQSLSATAHFPWRSNNVSAYKTLRHQHLAEIGESLAFAHPRGERTALHFVPWRGDFARGIFASCTTAFDGTLDEARAIFSQYYENQPFVHLLDGDLDLKQVLNTNKCLLQIELSEGQLVVHSAIDNLLKGASGQAVQNMNLMFGLDERAGLLLKPISF